jgi:hypothetical protein
MTGLWSEAFSPLRSIKQNASIYMEIWNSGARALSKKLLSEVFGRILKLKI